MGGHPVETNVFQGFHRAATHQTIVWRVINTEFIVYIVRFVPVGPDQVVMIVIGNQITENRIVGPQ